MALTVEDLRLRTLPRQFPPAGRADAVCVGRAALANPNWPTAAALELDVPTEQVPMARQYFRAKW